MHAFPVLKRTLPLLVLATALPPLPAAAKDEVGSESRLEARMAAMQRQMQAMQQELAALRRRSRTGAAATDRAVVQTGGAPSLEQQIARAGGPGGARPAPSKQVPMLLANDLVCNAGSYAMGQVCFTPGGFVELAGVFRNPNLASDIASDFNGIPFRNSLTAHENDFRLSARQSRLSGLFVAKVDPKLKVSGYYELDFLGAGVTSNSRESNSYMPRIRQVFASLDSLDTGWHLLVGQSWSLITTDTAGITPLKEQVPLTIDAQYVPGFTWTRNPQVRVVKDVAPGLWAGVSIESPQSILPPGPFTTPAGVTVNVNNSGDAGGLLNNSTPYSINTAPDVVAKLAFEPGFGHYEIKGLARFFEDRVIGRSNEETGFGIGAAAILPVVADRVDFQVSGLWGRGISRYGSGQLPDFALKANGDIATIPTFQLLTGVVAHVQPGTDVYAYAGWEHADRAGAPSTAGYGSPTLVVTGCDIEGAAAGTCQAETRSLRQITAGFWHDLYKGSYGRVVAGAQASYTERDAFRGMLGIAPSTHLVAGLASLRYYPF